MSRFCFGSRDIAPLAAPFHCPAGRLGRVGPVGVDASLQREKTGSTVIALQKLTLEAMSHAGEKAAQRCAVCGEEFASKNKLFSHLKGSGECARVTGRVSLRGNAPGTAVGAQCPASPHVQGMEARG